MRNDATNVDLLPTPEQSGGCQLSTMQSFNLWIVHDTRIGWFPVP
ncbi:unannotated protein [freshwater metagenome]|uniref:Unannotated protein n=1 Tax=freshwater metagenome TaxID=449393 RepID=A0A6J7JLQ8_9ZZZZ